MNAQELLAQSSALLLDFDGPVCSVFAGFPASVVADRLRALLADVGHGPFPDGVATTRDPFEVFRYAASLGVAEAREVEVAFTAFEVEAVASARATPGAFELMAGWRESDRPLSIVSNNSKAAIAAYLDLRGLRGLVNCISGRTDHDSSKLKPGTYLLATAASEIDIPLNNCVFIGDSLTDIQAARSLEFPVIGYANKPGKRLAFADAGADAVVESLRDLVGAQSGR